MNEPILEQVSAFLDGELPANETELLLKRLSRDAELRGAFGRFCAYGEAARDGGRSLVSRDFADRVNRAIDGEPHVDAGRAIVDTPRVWWRPLAGAALAASVAAAAVIALQHRTRPDSAPAPTMAAATQPATARTPQLAANTARASESLSYTTPVLAHRYRGVLPATRLTNYVVAHSEVSSPLGRRNVLSGLVAEEDTDLASPQAATP
jgi:sigma-E factor negative regulatory protein RseA